MNGTEIEDVPTRTSFHEFLEQYRLDRLLLVPHDMPRKKIKDFVPPEVEDHHIQIRLWEKYLEAYQRGYRWTKGKDPALFEDHRRAAKVSVRNSAKYSVPLIPTFKKTKKFMIKFFCYDAFHRGRRSQIKAEWARLALQGFPYVLRDEFWENYDKAHAMLYFIKYSMASFSAYKSPF